VIIGHFHVALTGAIRVVDIAAGRRYNTGMIRKRDSSLKIVFFLIFVFTFISCAKESKRVQPIKVACVGDSITFGAGLADKKKDSYPAVLGRALGNEYEVENFGVSGRTALRKGGLSYWNEKELRKAIVYNPNIVIIEFGANDSKPENWRFKDEFEKDYSDLVDVFLNRRVHRKVFICQPVPAFNKNYTISDSTIVNEIIPIIENVSKVKKVEVIELYKAFSGKEKLFLDGIHLNEEGCALMAKEIYKAIAGKEVIDKEPIAKKN
jgi:lysophospholipase L1-like esterase